MLLLKSILEEISDEFTMVSLNPRVIYNFYYLWYISLNYPRNDRYRREILEYYLQKYKNLYIDIFRNLLIRQLKKYITRRRIDSDFPVKLYDTLESLSNSEILQLMEKTFRSDMIRRNAKWNLIAEYVIDLEKSSTFEKIFLYIDRLNNSMHNTKTIVLDKFPNGNSLLHALNITHNATNPRLQYSQYVDKDIKELI